MKERSVWSCLCPEHERKHENLFKFSVLKNVVAGQVERLTIWHPFELARRPTSLCWVIPHYRATDTCLLLMRGQEAIDLFVESPHTLTCSTSTWLSLFYAPPSMNNLTLNDLKKEEIVCSNCLKYNVPYIPPDGPQTVRNLMQRTIARKKMAESQANWSEGRYLLKEVEAAQLT